MPEGETQMKVQPIDWQDDAEVLVEDGSTLADDDEAKAQGAIRNLQMFGGRPDMNQQKLAEDVLVASGKGSVLNEYFVPPQPQMPPPVTRPALSVSIKHETMTPEEKFAVYESAGIKVPGLNADPIPGLNPPQGMSATPPMPNMAAMGGGIPMPGPMSGPPPQPQVPAPNLPKAILAPPPDINPGAASVRAITGRNV